MISSAQYQRLRYGDSVQVPIEEEEGSFQMEDDNLLIFSTPVLEEVDYIPPSLREYVQKSLQDPYLQSRHLFILFDEEKRAFFLEGIWEFETLDHTSLNALYEEIRESASDIKLAIYKALCKDLVFVLAKEARNKL